MTALVLSGACLVAALIVYAVGARIGFERGYVTAVFDQALAEAERDAALAEFEGQIDAAREGRN